MEKDIFESKIFKAAILSIAGLIAVAFIFCLGVFVGQERAEYSFHWADQYHRNFGGPNGGIFGDFMGMDGQFSNGNGVFGQIIKIDGPILTVKGADNVEKIISSTDKTFVISQRKNLKVSDLKVGDSIVAIGQPQENGGLSAQLIRIIPTIK